MSLRLVPGATHPQSTTASAGAPSAPGVHDTLRSNLALTSAVAPKSSTSATAQPTSYHPLESRLAQWRMQQETLKMELLRRQFGIAEPVKRGMELAIVRAGEWTPAALGGGSSVHADILAGRETEIGWEDVYAGADGVLGARGEGVGEFHAEMEGRFGMGW
nr:proteasome maturation factor ump1 [Quercus suber]